MLRHEPNILITEFTEIISLRDFQPFDLKNNRNLKEKSENSIFLKAPRYPHWFFGLCVKWKMSKRRH